MTTHVLIHNTTAQLHGIGKESTNKKGAQIQDAQVTLKPGLNRVPAAAWETAKKQVMVQKHIEEGFYKELEKVDSLKSLSIPESKEMIGLCFDLELLGNWKKEDARKEVQKALTARIATIEKPEPGAVRPNLKGVKE